MTEQGWAKFSANSEIVSSIAVVVTLIYLAIQTQQTNEALLASSREATMTADVEIVSALISNPQAFANLHEPRSELSLSEQPQTANVLVGLLRIREFAWFQYKNGVLDETTLRSYLAPLTRWLQWEGAKPTWNLFSQEIDPEFVAYVDQILADTE
ncbi:hypothetical protein GWN28_21770 [candidate division KSB1 bacterium]|nr:hypothetical protein [candidate division KSB1 bacterium]NIU92889.1 hypothetical protein [candidate division KSB1 bacterium]NIW20935.1 hypothetical protein [candidate division KSB1 bacterium]NIW71397.1 hypothetical protein [candidate division KSB1 bacterium]